MSQTKSNDSPKPDPMNAQAPTPAPIITDYASL